MPQNQPPLPIAIIGLGLSGQSALDLLLGRGIPRERIITHDQKSPCDARTPEEVIARNPATLVVSPGVPLRTPWIQQLLKQGVRLSSELELAAQCLTSEKVVGITGAVGKSTVTSLLGAGLDAAGISNFTGGNLGFPFARYALERVKDQRPPAEYVVLELSSYQLENFASFKPGSTILTSLTPNHLERYDSLEEYYETKLSVAAKTPGPRFFNNSGLDLTKYRDRFQDARDHWTDRHDLAAENFQKMKMVGLHNRDNLALVWSWGQAHAMPPEFYQGLLNFPGLAHRLENLGERDGILFLNDSKATTMASVLQAADSVAELVAHRKSAHLLLGGRDKNLPWEQLNALKGRGFQFHFFGECGELARAKSALPGEVSPTLAAALDHILPSLKSGAMLLLSPGGTSLDEFKSFEDRGDFFRKRTSKP